MTIILQKNFKSGLETNTRVCPVEALEKVYCAGVQPHFDYCSSVWDSCNKGLKEKILDELGWQT